MDDKTVAIYCRVACADQMALSAQMAYLRMYAEENGYRNVAIYADNGFSGLRLDDRPGFTKMNADILAGEINTVIVRNHSRVGRNAFEVTAWIEGLAEKGVEFLTADYPYEPLCASLEDIFVAYRGVKRQHERKR